MIPTRTFENIHSQYVDAMAWLQQIGVNTPSGRVHHYESVLRYWKDSYETVTIEEANRDFPNFVSSAFEILEITGIYRAFHAVPNTELAQIKKKLSIAVNGPIHAIDEDFNTSEPRNRLFEVTVAANAHGRTERLSAILTADSDTGIKMDQWKLWVECKRIASANQLAKNVSKACRQLEAALNTKAGVSHRGLIALDVSKLFNKGNMRLVAQSDVAVAVHSAKLMDDFIAENSHIWQKIFQRSHHAIIGAILRSAYMSESTESNRLIYTAQWGLNPREGASRQDTNLVNTLAGLLDR